MIQRLRNRKGATALLLTVTAPILFAFTGLAAEAGNWYQLKRRAQTAADSAAIAGAMEIIASRASNMVTAARRESERNGHLHGEAITVSVNIITSGGGQAVEAIVTRMEPRLISNLFGDGDVEIRARGVSRIVTIGQACILALSPTADRAINVTGNNTTNLVGCSLAANSTSDSAIRIWGSGTLAAESLYTAGGIAINQTGNVTLSDGSVSYATVLPDPYAGLTVPVPPPGTCTGIRRVSATTTLSPGRYCNGLDLQNGTITLSPGTYYVENGNLEVGAQARVQCTCTGGAGVTIILTGSTPNQIGTVRMNAGAVVQLSAPSTGQYAGLLFVQDPRAPVSNQRALINGGAGTDLNGMIYFRNTAVEYSGNSVSSSSGCLQIIANTVELTGNSTFQSSGCAALGVPPVIIRGVELIA